MGQLEKVEQRREQLGLALEKNRDYVHSMIPIEKEEEFKTNFMELAQNGYLMDKIPPKEILITALNATKMGLNVNPIYKELYVLPFNVDKKGMVASIVVTFNGNAQMAYNNGFFLKSDPVFNVGGKARRKSEIPLEQLVGIKTTDTEWVKENTLGWYIGLEDISNNEIKLPDQEVFVEFGYAMHVAKQLQSPDHLLQTLLHKVVRRAISEMIIPRGRGFIAPDEHEAEVIVDDTPSEPKDVKSALLDKDEEAVEAVVEEEVVDVRLIQNYYGKHRNTAKGNAIEEEMMKDLEWRKFTPEKLSELYETLKAL